MAKKGWFLSFHLLLWEDQSSVILIILIKQQLCPESRSQVQLQESKKKSAVWFRNAEHVKSYDMLTLRSKFHIWASTFGREVREMKK